MKWLAFTGILEITDTTRRDVNERLRREAAQRASDTFLVDLAALCDADPATMARADGLHFAESGYRRLGEEAALALRSFCT